MKYLTLVLLLSNGEIANNAMPSHDCYADCHHGAHAVLMSREDDHA